MKLRIATYNIHKGVTAVNQRPRIHTLKRALRSLSADVMFLQEVQGRHDLLAVRMDSKLLMKAQHEFLAGKRFNCAYGMNAEYGHGHHGNALLSCFPIPYSENLDISDHMLESRGILHCVVQAEQVNVHCYVVHLGLFSGGRKRQTEALIQQVLESAPIDSPIIIAGDFNDWGNQLSETLRASLGVCEVFDKKYVVRGFRNYLRRLTGRSPKISSAKTFPSAMPMLRLDRIYVRGFEVESAEVLRDERWSKLSDHAPIVACLRLKKKPQEKSSPQ